MYRDKASGQLVFSPSDLCKYWESEFASWMDRYDLEFPGQLKPNDDDGLSRVLQKKGYDHEEATIRALTSESRKIFRIDNKAPNGEAEAQTLAAMKRGEDVIFQARLNLLPFAGWADFLVKTPGNSNLGNYHYEVWDTKLSKKLKPYFILQLCTYSEMLETFQGQRPEQLAVVLGDGTRKVLRLDDFFYYYLSTKEAFLKFQETFDSNNRPDPEKYRSYGKWEDEAKKILLEQDALTQVAHLTSVQARNLKAAGIKTMTELAASTEIKIPKMGAQVFASLKIQAKLQIDSAGKERPAYIIRTDNTSSGLYNLPAPSKGDVFFDIEGFPLVDGGLEYLWGNAYRENGKPAFRDFWAHNKDEEKKALEDFIDWVYARWRENPDMHVYHYANYEIAVLRRLGRHGTREREIDQLLRHEIFVDLYTVVKHGLYVGEPRYSIKNIEHLYRGKREGDVTDGGASVEFYEAWRSSPDGKSWEDSKILRAIRDYNIDDCYSTMELCDWLRAEQLKAGIPAKAAKHVIDDEVNDDKEATRSELRTKLLAAAKSRPEATVLAQLVDFYRREAKPTWWKFFDRLAALPEELYDDADCLSGLEAYMDAEPYSAKKFRRVYSFDPDQECKLGIGDKCVHHSNSELKVEVEDIDYERGFIALVGTKEALPEQLTIIPHDQFAHEILAKSLTEFCGKWLSNPDAPNAVSDFLTRKPPRLKNRNGAEPTKVAHDGGDFLNSVIQAVLDMDHTIMCIQGPPGTGKTYTAEHIISTLAKKGLRVGIASNSHKAINNLLLRAATCSKKQGISGKFVKVSRHEEEELKGSGQVELVATAKNLKLTSDFKVIGGTAWTFASDHLEGQIDYLFIDEAGQVSIANLIAMARSTKNIVVIGDQMQLSQPIQGAHPGDSGKSILDYYMGEHATVPDTHGVFLPLTYRMHPSICDFISGAVYEDRLKSAPECDKQNIDHSKSKFLTRGSGITFVPIVHEGNSQASDEEVEAIKEIFKDLIGREFRNKSGNARKITADDILVVAPYNLQVRKLQEALGDNARVGSVDKFQGQEAPVVILSMCSSDASSARGVDFLFNKNRLNVAVSRAQAKAIIVGHPRLAMTFSTSVEKLAMINMYCRLVRAGSKADKGVQNRLGAAV